MMMLITTIIVTQVLQHKKSFNYSQMMRKYTATELITTSLKWRSLLLHTLKKRHSFFVVHGAILQWKQHSTVYAPSLNSLLSGLLFTEWSKGLNIHGLGWHIFFSCSIFCWCVDSSLLEINDPMLNWYYNSIEWNIANNFYEIMVDSVKIQCTIWLLSFFFLHINPSCLCVFSLISLSYNLVVCVVNDKSTLCFMMSYDMNII